METYLSWNTYLSSRFSFFWVLVKLKIPYQIIFYLSFFLLKVTLVFFFVGKQRRLQFVECANDINAMIDAAKFADLVLLLTDGSYGFEMVCFAFPT